MFTIVFIKLNYFGLNHKQFHGPLELESNTRKIGNSFCAF